MIGESNLDQLIAHMEPVLNAGEYVFVTLEDTANIPREVILGEFREKEGITLILDRKDADDLGLVYHWVAAWITLNVHSSLEAVGLTAAFSSELARHGISCNVIAGFYHDHIFVDKKDGQKALNLLGAMAKEKREG